MDSDYTTAPLSQRVPRRFRLRRVNPRRPVNFIGLFIGQEKRPALDDAPAKPAAGMMMQPPLHRGSPGRRRAFAFSNSINALTIGGTEAVITAADRALVQRRSRVHR